jgi:hypothetical protein
MTAPPEQRADFFLAHLSSSGHQLSLINPPPMVSESLATNLRAALPRNIGSDRYTEDNVLIIETKSGGYDGRDFHRPIHRSQI